MVFFSIRFTDMNTLRVGAYPAYNHRLALRDQTDEDAASSIESTSFRSPHGCGLPASKDFDTIDGVVEALVRVPILKLGRAVGAFRHLVACSRPRIHRAPEVEDDQHMMLKSGGSSDDDKVFEEKVEMREMSLECLKMRIELQAVLRHLQVRWQLFNEAMTKWCDLESMLAICTENVTWSGGSGVVISGKNSPLLSETLRSLLTRKLSYHVVIERITRLSPMVFPDLSLDKNGNCVELVDSELRNAAASLDMLLGSCKKDVYSEDCWHKDLGPYMVLENHWYTLQDAQGKIVEQGSRTVLWKQHNSTWYIRACMICPSDKEPSLI